MTDPAEKSPVAEAGIKSIEVGCRLLNVLANIQHPINLGELALLSKMSPSKAHRYLVSFQRTKLVQQDAQTHRYALGELALKLGYSAAAQANPLRQLQHVQVALRDKTTHTVLLSVWTDGGPVVMGVEDGLSPVVATMKPGATLPLMSSAAGRVFAASMPWSVIEPLIQQEIISTLDTRDPNTVAAAAGDFLRSLGPLRERGMEHRHNSLLPHINAIAAPFVDRRNRLVGALSIIGDADILDISYEGETAHSLREASHQFRTG